MRIEAESFSGSSGVQTVKCAEGTSGNMAVQLNTHDWVEYPVTITQSGVYKVDVRVAAIGSILWIYDNSGNVLGKIPVTKTASDQTYGIASKKIFIKSTVTALRFQLRDSSASDRSAVVNINYIDINSTNLLVCNDFESDWDIYTPGNFPWASATSDATLSTWETGTGFYGWIRQTARTESLQLYNNVSGTDRSAAVFELKKSDNTTWPNVRSEMYKTACPHQEMWFGFDFMCPTDLTGDGLAHTLFQFHSQGGGLSPCISLRVEGGNYTMKVLWSNILNPTTHQGEASYTLGSYTAGEWIKWVIHVKFAWDNTGILEVWKDGTKVADRQNLPNCYNEAAWPYPKVGIYKWGWTPQWVDYSPYDTLIHYYDNLRIGGPSSSYNEVTS